MSPHEEAKHRDRDGAERDEAEAEDVAMAVHRDDVADDAHAGQHHDVHRRMRVEPEEVLEQHGIAAHRRVKDSDVETALDDQECDGDAQHGSREHLDDRGRIDRPQEQRHAEPGHSWRTQLVNGHDEVEAGEDRREAEDEHAHQHWDGSTRRELRGVRRVERPTGIESTREQ